MNLKQETLEILKENGKTKDDIIWAGCPDFEIPLDLFWKLADKEYDSGYGAQEVASDLIVVGAGFWLERLEYDGSEWWEYKEFISRPKETRNVEKIISRECSGWWSSIAEMNGFKEKEY